MELMRIEDAKEYLIQGEGKPAFLRALYRNLEHIGCDNLVRLSKCNPEMPLPDLDKIIQREIGHMMPFSLASSVLAYLTKVGGVTMEQLQANLVDDQLCVSVENVVVNGSPRVSPDHIKATLYPPQQALLARMLYLERMEPHQIGKALFVPRLGVISERIGFGKTFLSCALLAHKREVVVPDPLEIEEFSLHPLFNIITSPPLGGDDLVDIPLDIVICNLKTAAIWESNLDNLTDLRVHKITSVKMLESFQSMVERDDLPDVLIVKDGKLQSELTVESVTRILQPYRVNRVLVDDYDILNMPRDTTLPEAKFYWLISSTRSNHDKEAVNRRSAAGRSGRTLDAVIKNIVIFDNFSNLRCATNYLTREYQVPQITTYFSEVFSEDKMCTACTKKTSEIWQVPCVDCAEYQAVAPEPLCAKCQTIYDHDLEIDSDDDQFEDDPETFCDPCCEIMDRNHERAYHLCDRCIHADLAEVFEYCAKCKQTGIMEARDRVVDAIEDFLTRKKACTLMEEVPRYYSKLLPGTADKPLTKGDPIKAIFLAEGNDIAWEFSNMDSVMITHRNIKAFETSEAQIGICKKLSGVDMSYITHVIVTDLSETEDIIQFIGRAQRLGRTSNLEVLVLQYL